MPNPAGPQNPASISLYEWRVMEISTRNGARSRHLLGHDLASKQGRASTAIIAFDLASMTATTGSGRRYQLVDQPGDSPLARAAWKKWCSDHEVETERDVTAEYLPSLEQQADTTITFTKLGRGARRHDEQ